MRLRVLNGNQASSFDSVPGNTSMRESPLRLRKKPAPILLIPSTSVLSAERVHSRSMLSSLFHASCCVVRAAQVHGWVRVVAITYSFAIDDIRIAAFPLQADIYVDVSLVLCIVLFLLDIAIRIAKFPDYLWSLYFYLDLLATAAVCADINFLASDLYSPCDSGLLRAHKAAGKAARLGASSLSLLTYIRKRDSVKLGGLQTLKTEDEISLLPDGHATQVVPDNSAVNLIAPLFPPKSPAIKRESTDTPARHAKRKSTLGRLYHLPTQQATTSKPTKKKQQRDPSRIGERLAERTVTLVVLIVLAITLANIWITNEKGFTDNQTRENYGLKLLLDARNGPWYGDFVNEFLERNTDDNDMQYVVKVVIPGFTDWERTSSHRSTDLCSVSFSSASISLNYANKNRLLAIFSLCQTLILCVLTLSIVIWLNADVNNLLVFPLERMMRTVASLVQNPLNMFKLRPDVRKGLFEDDKGCCGIKKDFAHEEIRILENAFRKIGVMLALVYGSAGSELITSCIKQEGIFSPLLPGREILAIFSFVHISHFDDILEKLNNKMLAYVNQIARLVHSQSEKHMGSVNRNMGDAFLLVWKFKEEEGVHVAGKFQVNAFSDTVKETTSLALLSSIKTISKVVRSKTLTPEQSHFEAAPSLTFGFHVGWAYEGPIGSYFKIDASYLSPHVNIASRVESAAKQYDVHILVSEEFYIRLEMQVQSFLRHIDTVELQGVALPVKLYSFDLHTSGLGTSEAKPAKLKIDRKRKRLKDALDTKLLFIYELFTQSDEIAHMRRHYTDQFFEAYEEGLELYIKGRWQQAADIFCSICDLPDLCDGPSLNLLGYMRNRGLTPPSRWRGVRHLMSK